MVATLRSHADGWAATPLAEKAKLLRASIAAMERVVEEGAHLSTIAKGSYGYGDGEELTTWSFINMGLSEIAEALEGRATVEGVRKVRGRVCSPLE